jgi:hypothetical protein
VTRAAFQTSLTLKPQVSSCACERFAERAGWFSRKIPALHVQRGSYGRCGRRTRSAKWLPGDGRSADARFEFRPAKSQVLSLAHRHTLYSTAAFLGRFAIYTARASHFLCKVVKNDACATLFSAFLTELRRQEYKFTRKEPFWLQVTLTRECVFFPRMES